MKTKEVIVSNRSNAKTTTETAAASDGNSRPAFVKKPSKFKSVMTLFELFPRQIGDQIEFAKLEIKDKGKSIGVSAGLLVVGVIFLFFMLTALIVALIAWLGTVIPPGFAALIVAGVFLLIMLILVLVGIKKLKNALPLSPEKAMRGLAIDMGVLTEGSKFSVKEYDTKQAYKKEKKKLEENEQEALEQQKEQNVPQPLSREDLSERIEQRRNHILSLSDVVHGNGNTSDVKQALAFAQDDKEEGEHKKAKSEQKKLVRKQEKLDAKAAKNEEKLKNTSDNFSNNQQQSSDDSGNKNIDKHHISKSQDSKKYDSQGSDVSDEAQVSHEADQNYSDSQKQDESSHLNNDFDLFGDDKDSSPKLSKRKAKKLQRQQQREHYVSQGQQIRDHSRSGRTDNFFNDSDDDYDIFGDSSSDQLNSDSTAKTQKLQAGISQNDDGNDKIMNQSGNQSSVSKEVAASIDNKNDQKDHNTLSNINNGSNSNAFKVGDSSNLEEVVVIEEAPEIIHVPEGVEPTDLGNKDSQSMKSIDKNNNSDIVAASEPSQKASVEDVIKERGVALATLVASGGAFAVILSKLAKRKK